MEVKILALLIAIFGAINLLRMAIFLVGSDIYELIQVKRLKKTVNKKHKFTVIIPAFNEENTVVRAIKSVLNSNYPKNLLEVIVVDDGSIDQTVKNVENFIATTNTKNVKIITQKGSGKAHALNKGIKAANGELVMCLDADSYLGQDSIKNANKYFDDNKVIALASNVKIIKRPGLLNLVQLYEYIVCYQMKRAESLLNCEYIVGGIGSIFRKSALEKVGLYDTNTVTEDIDVTMKLLQLGNKENQVLYGANVVAYTEAVISVSDLIKQRFRWKWGRSQTFVKNANLFLSSDQKYSKSLTWFYLPFAIFGDIAYFVEPVLLSYIIYVSFAFNNFLPIIGAWVTISTYVLVNIVAEATIKVSEKIKLAIVAPFMYALFYVLSFVEYIALIGTLVKIGGLKKSLEHEVHVWDHVERASHTETNKWVFSGVGRYFSSVLVIAIFFVTVSVLSVVSYFFDSKSQAAQTERKIASIKVSKPDSQMNRNKYSDYVVNEGESLWSISKQELGLGSRWNELVTEDGSTVIHPGDVVKIPQPQI